MSEPEKGSKAGLVLEALRELGNGTIAQVAEVAETTPAKAQAHLCNLLRDGLVTRSGCTGSWMYSSEARHDG